MSEAKIMSISSEDLPQPRLSEQLRSFIAAGKPHEVARVLQETSDALAEAGISPSLRISQSPWHILQSWTLRLAESDDAMVIFGAMVHGLKNNAFGDRVILMQTAFASPSWGVRAIDTYPSFFRAVEKKSNKPVVQEDYPVNAFQALAMMNPSQNMAYCWTTDIIKALKRTGLQDHKNPHTLACCIHMAASYRGPDSLKAFVEAFPENIESTDISQETPLHRAARIQCSANVKTLLDQGANPRPKTNDALTPLYFAIADTWFDNAMILLESGAYGKSELNHATETLARNHGNKFSREIEQLEAFLDAVKAKEALGEPVNQESSLRPL